MSPLTHHGYLEVRYGGKETGKYRFTNYYCLQAKHVANPHLLSAVRTGWYTFDKYYSLTDKVTAHAAALLLAPHRRKAYLYGKELEEWIPRAIENVRTLWGKRCTPVGSVHKGTR